MRTTRLAGALCALLIGSGCAATAGAPGPHVGVVGRFDQPTGEFGAVQGDGFSVGGLAEVRLTNVSLIGEAAWTRFSGLKPTADRSPTDALSFVEIGGGLRVYGGPFHAGAQVGWVRGSEHDGQFVLRPGIGVSLLGVDLLGQYRYGRDAQWWSMGLGFKLF